jgi:hypothetical protein
MLESHPPACQRTCVILLLLAKWKLGIHPIFESLRGRRRFCDLIVIGTHGRRGLDHVLHGSTAEQVVRAAPCPVLVVKPSAHATHISHERS